MPDTLLSLDGQGKPQGYGVEVANRIAAELAVAVGRPVSLRFVPLTDPGSLGTRLAEGKADLACGVPFSWDREMSLDYSLPIGLSGLRLLAPKGRFDGAPAGLAHHRIAVVKDSLAGKRTAGHAAGGRGGARSQPGGGAPGPALRPGGGRDRRHLAPGPPGRRPGPGAHTQAGL
jgi:ABC-type amino acid transport substrate-binding protein